MEGSILHIVTIWQWVYQQSVALTCVRLRRVALGCADLLWVALDCIGIPSSPLDDWNEPG